MFHSAFHGVACRQCAARCRVGLPWAWRSTTPLAMLCQLRVAAVTDAGVGAWSAVVTAENNPASPPLDLNATQVADGADLTWSPPTDTFGLTILAYVVHASCTSGRGDCDNDYVDGSNPRTSTLYPYDIDHNAHCTYIVRTDTAAGLGIWSASGVGLTPAT